MGVILDALHRLQKIERKLNKHRSKAATYRRKIEQGKQLIDANQAEYDAHLKAVRQCQVGIDAADLDIKTREESMAKHRVALNSAKTNKDYAAILTALNTEKADTSKYESRVLELMAEKDELLSKSKTFEDEREKLLARLEKRKKDLDDYLARTREELESLEKERAAAAADIPPSALAAFERVASKHEGEAMAEILRIGSRGDDHICEGCNMSVTLEVVNKLRSLDDLVLCNTCGRILFHAHEGASA
ncbi:MAG TPA: C4-type zinc ribbon domain-containing protein [Phycisphaerae bacterium]|nr:C4-type zinc ribbon domain-containing protein [Phycisphaerae bacterium]